MTSAGKVNAELVMKYLIFMEYFYTLALEEAFFMFYLSPQSDPMRYGYCYYLHWVH